MYERKAAGRVHEQLVLCCGQAAHRVRSCDADANRYCPLLYHPTVKLKAMVSALSGDKSAVTLTKDLYGNFM